MNKPFLLDAYEEFKEKLRIISESGETYIAGLEDKNNYRINIDKLFRLFHSLKPACHYLGYMNIYNVTVAIEDLLSALRLQLKPPRKDVIDWLFSIYDYLCECERISRVNGDNFPVLDSFTLTMFKTSIISSSKEVNPLQDKTILILAPNIQWLESATKKLEKVCKSVIATKSLSQSLEAVRSDTIDFLLIWLNKDSLDVAIEFRGLLKGPSLAIVSEKFDKNIAKVDDEVIVDSFIPTTITFEELNEKVNQYASLYFQEKLIKLTDKKVTAKLKELKALPESLIALQKAANDDSIALRDIANIVVKDPIMSVKILEAINSPLYGLTQRVDSVSQAVTLLGKDRTVSLCVQASIGAQLSIDLAPYGLTVRNFYKIAQLRNEIAVGWFSKVSFADVPLISTSSLIGNIGQILIAKVLKERSLDSKFTASLASSDRLHAEIEFVGATSEDITADMLSIWGMNPELIDSIRYAFDLAHCPDHIKKLAIANFIIFSLVPATDDIIDEYKKDSLIEFANEMNLKGDALAVIIDKILNNQPIL